MTNHSHEREYEPGTNNAKSVRADTLIGGLTHLHLGAYQAA
jgi:hypothetical protein